jgi:hypothetical protein
MTCNLCDAAPLVVVQAADQSGAGFCSHSSSIMLASSATCASDMPGR